MPNTYPSRTMRLVRYVGRQLIFARMPLGLLFLVTTIVLGISATNTRFDTGFSKLIPKNHEFMEAFNEYADEFSGTNRVMVSLEWLGEGDIYNATFLESLRHATDEVYFTPGVNQTTVRSLFSPAVRYAEVTEFGFTGGEVIPSLFNANKEGLARVRSNVSKSGQIGNLVSKSQTSAMVQAELLEFDPMTGEKTDYAAVAQHLENIRQQFEDQDLKVQIIGFSKVMGDVMDGLSTVVLFFFAAFVITALLLWVYSKSLKLTILALVVALLPVIWLLGILPLIGYGIDPMSMLVPFLIFSIGVSHAVQMTNAWKQEMLSGASSLKSAENTFCQLAIPGIVALLANALGFLVIMFIDIPMVHELGVTACLGVALMIITNKMFMPIILSHLKLEKVAFSARSNSDKPHRLWWAISNLARPGPALASFLVVLILLAIGTYESRDLLIGDVGSGVPELRQDSRYNLDNAKIISDYSIGMDVLSVYVETRGSEEACLNWDVMSAVDRFDLHMRGVDGVESTSTVAALAKLQVSGNNEGSPRWQTLQRSEMALRAGSSAANLENGLNTAGCKAINIMLYLEDHENSTLKHVVHEIESFIENDTTENVIFHLAGGNAGVAAATNEAVERAEALMLISIFAAISLLCLLTFRSWRGTLCVVVPLVLVSIMCSALMSILGIGLKVATLPVIALGVGVGVDYGIYIYERLQHEMHENGVSLQVAFYRAMEQRGTAAVFTAITMTLGVGTWAFSALKFQADMGVLLAFMFLVNVLGAIFLLPALACWLNVEAKERDKKLTPS